MSANNQTHNLEVRQAAAKGFLFQVVLAAVLFFLSAHARSATVFTVALFAGSGVLAWAAVFVAYRLQGSTKQPGGERGIFRRLFFLAALRVEFMVALLVAVLLAAAALWPPENLLDDAVLGGDRDVNRLLVFLLVSSAATFAGFVGVLYFRNISRAGNLDAIKPGVSYSAGAVILLGLSAVSYVLEHFGFPAFDYLGPGAAFVSGAVCVEIVVFASLSLFRPLGEGRERRPAFESRLLGLILNPAAPRRVVADALNYQLGFDASENRSVKRVAFFIDAAAVLAVVALWAFTSVVTIEEGRRALLMRFGRPTGGILGPGLHLKAPWPIDELRAYDVAGLRKIHVGSHRAESDNGTVFKSNVPILWTNQHGISRESLMIAASPGHLAVAEAGGTRSRAPSISLVGGDVYVEYRISDLSLFVTASYDTEYLFRQLAEREVSRTLMKYDVDTILGSGRKTICDEIKKALGELSDERSLGLEVVSVGFIGAHPPQDVAGAFEQMEIARQYAGTCVQKAMEEKVYVLTQAAGRTEYADELLELIRDYEKADKSGADREVLAAKDSELLSRMIDARGGVTEKLHDATAFRWERENAEKGAVEEFDGKLKAFKASPRMYMVNDYLSALADGLEKARKFIVVGDKSKLLLRFENE